MKKAGNKIHAKAISMISVVLIAATLTSMLAFPVNAATYSWSDSGEIYSTTTDVHPQLGIWEISASYNSSTYKMSWSGTAGAVYTMDHAASNISYGYSAATVYKLSSSENKFVKIVTTSTTTITSYDDNGDYYTTTDSLSAKSNFLSSYFDGYPRGRVYFTQTLKSKLYGYAGTTNENVYFKFNSSYSQVSYTQLSPI